MVRVLRPHPLACHFVACTARPSGLAISRSVAQTLALANQSAVLVSMVLALVSETSLLQGSASRRGCVFILLWFAVQLVRVMGMALGLLTDDVRGATVVAAFVFVDKYTGPLGNAAVEAALLVTLHQQRESSAAPPPVAARSSWVPTTVPATLLLTMRLAVESVCRPFAELLLTPPGRVAAAGGALASHWPVSFELVVPTQLSPPAPQRCCHRAGSAASIEVGESAGDSRVLVLCVALMSGRR